MRCARRDTVPLRQLDLGRQLVSKSEGTALDRGLKVCGDPQVRRRIVGDLTRRRDDLSVLVDAGGGAGMRPDSDPAPRSSTSASHAL
jgi:hypothetical protein